VNVLVARASEEIDLAYSRLSTGNPIGCDTETSSLNSKYGKLFSIQFSDGEFNVLVPLSEGVRIGKLADVLADPSTIKIFHNAKFDLDFLNAVGVSRSETFSTL
jgi:ribonuclease D